MLSLLRSWRERGWSEVDAAVYAEAWQRFGGSVATHPVIVERLANLARIHVRYLAWSVGGEVLAAIPCWGDALALSKDVLKARRQRGVFDLGNAEVILPIADNAKVPVRQRVRYLSEINTEQIIGLRLQAEGLAIARAPQEYSVKFRYNQRRELRLFEQSGGYMQPIHDLSPVQQALTYAELFQRRWGFAPKGKSHLGEVFTLLREFMRGSVLMREQRPIAIQIVYRVESPRWLSFEYINGGVDPDMSDFSPGSVLTFVNTQAAWDEARQLGKPLRYSFGRADPGYKERWCHRVPVYKI